MALCSSCNAEVIWAKHERTGDLAPLDKVPTPEGKWHMTEQLDLAGDTHTIYSHGDSGGHTNHFATCPNAAAHRRQPIEGA